jgi:hypothetical protein
MIAKDMKHAFHHPLLAAACLLALATPSGQGATTITFSATHKETVVGNSASGYSKAVSGTGSLTAVIPAASSAFSDLDTTSSFVISIGGAVAFDNTLGSATTYKKGAATAQWTSSYPRVNLSWAGGTLRVSLSDTSDIFELGTLFSSNPGIIQNQPELLVIQLGDYAVTNTILLNGATSLTNVSKGSGAQFVLLNVTVSGGTDSTPPQLAILQPAANAIFYTTNSVVLSGTVVDTSAITNLDFLVSSNASFTTATKFVPASIDTLTTWSAAFTPLPGTNYIFVRAFDAFGNVTLQKRTIFYEQPAAVTVEIAEGYGALSGITNGQTLGIGRTYNVTARPGKGEVFVAWATNGVLGGTTTNISFTMEEGLGITLYFRDNPFPGLKGSYAGLFYDTDHDLNLTNAGAFTVTVATNGTCSGKLTLAASSLSFSGKLGLQTNAPNTAYATFLGPNAKSPTIAGTLVFDATGSGAISGSVWNVSLRTNQWTTNLTASAFGQLCQPAVKTASRLYNLALTATNEAPGNFSFGSATLSSGSTIKLALNLADKISATTVGTSLCTDQSIPFFLPLYSKRGAVLGWLHTDSTNTAADLFADALLYAKLGTTGSASFYTNAQTSLLSAAGSLYTAPKGGTNILGWTDGYLSIDDGKLTTTLTFNPAKNTFVLPAAAATNKLSLKLAPATGQISGSFTPVGTKKALSFKGIVLPKQAQAFGFATGTNSAVPVILRQAEEPTPPTPQPPI